MTIAGRLRYYHRIFSAYLTSGESHLSFWHEMPRENPRASADTLAEYYMCFPQKAGYVAHLDTDGIPLLNYRGRIGLQYNPIAISQWGLGNYNLFRGVTASEDRNHVYKQKFLAASDWLCSNLKQNSYGVWVWNHDFEWEYRDTLKAPWYSGLAQGQAISLLVRAHAETGNSKYIEASDLAFESFLKSVDEGGVIFIDEQKQPWIEEYIVHPPTHILNGFIWAVWGVRDYYLATKRQDAQNLLKASVKTLRDNLQRYDLGFWSLYEQSGTFLPMVASPFYHQLHIVQLRIMHRLTGDTVFAEYADRWQRYAARWPNRLRALCYKSLFKLCYY